MAACARTNDLCKCSICYPCSLSFYPPPPAIPTEHRKRGKDGARGLSEGSERLEKERRERGEKEERERRERGSSIPEPGLDPRPSPPKSSTAARPQFRFVLSAPLSSLLLFSPSPPRRTSSPLSFSIFSVSFFSPLFLHLFSTFPTRPRRQPLDPSLPPSLPPLLLTLPLFYPLARARASPLLPSFDGGTGDCGKTFRSERSRRIDETR